MPLAAETAVSIPAMPPDGQSDDKHTTLPGTLLYENDTVTEELAITASTVEVDAPI
jgi:hypothetical protein